MITDAHTPIRRRSQPKPVRNRNTADNVNIEKHGRYWSNEVRYPRKNAIVLYFIIRQCAVNKIQILTVYAVFSYAPHYFVVRRKGFNRDRNLI